MTAARRVAGRLTDLEPAPVDGAALLDDVRGALTRFVILPSDATTDAVVLWIAATHAQPAWAHAPRLVIRAPEKRCGKSRLLDVIEATYHDPLITVNASPAAVYRPSAPMIRRPCWWTRPTRSSAPGGRPRPTGTCAGCSTPATSATGPRSATTPTLGRSNASPPSRWQPSPGSGTCPTRSRTGPSSSGCAAADPANTSTRSGTAATGRPSPIWPASYAAGCARTSTSSPTPCRPCPWKTGQRTPGNLSWRSPTWPPVLGPTALASHPNC